MNADELLRLLTVLGAHFWRAHLIGGAPPFLTRQTERMRAIQPGDLVLELTALYRPGTRVEDAIGFLVAITDRDIVDEDGEGWQERHWIIRRLVDGQEVDWTNATFVALPTTLGDWPPGNP